MKVYLKKFSDLTLKQLYAILQLREAVFSHEQKCTEKDFDGLDTKAIHIYGVQDGKMIAVARILPPGVYKKGVVSFGRVAVHSSYRGKGYAKAIMQKVLKYLKAHYPEYPIEFSAQYYLKSFYESLGFKAKGKIYSEGGLPHIKMISAR